MKKNKIFLFFFIFMFVFLNISFVEAFVCCPNQELAVGCENGCSQIYCINCGEHEEGYCTYDSSAEIQLYNLGEDLWLNNVDLVDIANAPVLSNGMVPVKWIGGISSWVVTEEDDPEWYNYENNKWANVMLRDGLVTEPYGRYQKVTTEGSMFVWIPRYTYKIDNGEVDVRWSFGIVDNTSEGYLRHPAFYMGEYKGGELNQNSSFSGRTGKLNELTGFWMAKYMASEEKDENDEVKISFKSGKNVETSYMISDAFTKALELKENAVYDIGETGVFTHLTKNSEWGAVAYLTMAKGNIPGINNSNTENQTGIFDLVSEYAEYTSGFNPVEDLMLNELKKEANKEYVEQLIKQEAEYNGLALGSELMLLDVGGARNFVDDTNTILTRGSTVTGFFGYKSEPTTANAGFRTVIAIDDVYMKGEIALFETEASVVEGDSLLITVDFSVHGDSEDEKWKFDLSDTSLGIKENIMNAVKLKFVQEGINDAGDTINIATDQLNQQLLQMIVINDDGTGQIIEDSELDGTFDVHTNYMLKITVGGKINGENVFAELNNCTSKIIVEEMDVLTLDSKPLEIDGYPYDKIRLTIFDIDGQALELESVMLGTAPDKKTYYIGEEIDTSGGKLLLKYKGIASLAAVELKKMHVDNYQHLTDEAGIKTVTMTYNGKTVTTEKDGEIVPATFEIEVINKYKVNVFEQLMNGTRITLGAAKAIPNVAALNESIALTAQNKNGYKFASWSIDNVELTDAEKIDPTISIVQPSQSITAIAKYRGVSYFEVIEEPTKEFANGDPFTLGPMHLIAHYEDGSEEDVTADTPGLDTNISIGYILGADPSVDVVITYGGLSYEYEITVGYKMNLKVNCIYAGSIEDGVNGEIKVPINDVDTLTQCISVGTILNYLAQPNEDYEFNGWTSNVDGLISDLMEPSVIFSMPAREVTLIANFVSTKYKIDYLATDGGKVEGETSQIVKRGENTDYVTAVANTGYYFDSWDDGITDAERREINVQESKIYTAKFYRGHKVSFYAKDILIGEPQIVLDGEDAIPPDDSEVPVIEGYTFTGEWSDSYFDVQEDLIIEAIYENNNYMVMADYPVEMATVTGTGFYAYESDVILSVEGIKAGNKLSRWILYKEQDGEWIDATTELCSDATSSSTLSFNMPACNVKAVIEFENNVLIGVRVNGVVVYSYFKVGSEQTIQAGNDGRYEFSEWTDDPGFMDDAASQASTTTINIPSVATKINAEFDRNSPLYYLIKTTAGNGGTITATQQVELGSRVEISITPDAGYKLSKLIFDGNEVEVQVDIPSLLYEYVNRDVSIEAIFEPI